MSKSQTDSSNNVDWSNKICVDCGVSVELLGILAPFVKGEGYLCHNCKTKRDSNWFEEHFFSKK